MRNKEMLKFVSVNWKKDVKLEEVNRLVCQEDEKLEGRKIRRYTLLAVCISAL